MSNQSGITYERVKQAAETLRAAGRPVSNREVRRELGEGSFETIAPLLKRVKEEWRQAAETAEKLAAAGFPTDFAAVYYRNVQREKDAVRESQRQVIEDLRVQVAEAEEAFSGALLEREELSDQIARERAEAADKIRGLEVTVGSQRERAAALDENLRQVRGERDAALAAKTAFASEQTRLQLGLKRSEEELQEARQRVARLEAQIESLQKDLADFAQRAAVAERHAADIEAVCSDLRQRCQALEADRRELQGERRDITSRLLETQTALAEARQQAATADVIVEETAKAKKPITAPSAAKAAQTKAKTGDGASPP